MNTKRKYVICTLILSFLLVGTAARAIEWGNSNLENPIGADSFIDLANMIVEWIRGVAIAVSTIMIIWSGVLFMTAMGEREKIAKAKTALTWAIIGLAIVVIGTGWITFVQSFLTE